MVETVVVGNVQNEFLQNNNPLGLFLLFFLRWNIVNAFVLSFDAAVNGDDEYVECIIFIAPTHCFPVLRKKKNIRGVCN